MKTLRNLVVAATFVAVATAPALGRTVPYADDYSAWELDLDPATTSTGAQGSQFYITSPIDYGAGASTGTWTWSVASADLHVDLQGIVGYGAAS